MTEAEGSFRERRSAYSPREEETESRPAPSDEPGREPETPSEGPAGDRDARIAMPDEPARPEPEEQPETPPFPEGAFFDAVQYVVLRVSQCLGEIPFDETGVKRLHPREAKGYIDLLTVLRERTRDDLSQEAARALDNLLSDLRLRYLELT